MGKMFTPLILLEYQGLAVSSLPVASLLVI